MKTEAIRALGCTGVPWGTSKQNEAKGNEGMRLKAASHSFADDKYGDFAILMNHSERDASEERSL